jgi:2-polyprenyl-6-methoxyphenol hydroxylase-like FAD-dependent oxidoreductase
MPADRAIEVPVVIAGTGPAGLVAAVTLARNGIRSLLVERNPGLSPLPRATAVSTRTMELLRSWGWRTRSAPASSTSAPPAPGRPRRSSRPRAP